MIDIIEETKKHYVKVLVTGKNINQFIKLLYKFHIKLDNIEYIDETNIIIKILKTDEKRIRNEFKDYKFRRLNDEGIYQIKPFVKKHIIIILAVIWGIFFLFFLNRIIVKVEVIHSKKEIREIVTNELETYNVKRLTLKKSYKELEEIKKKILKKYPDRLEWIEIEVKGMNYIVRIEERILTYPKEEKSSCHIVSLKDANITKIIAHKGETVKRVDNYVRKGDIIISGYIKLNEAIKGTVCAEGLVYGEVWYTATSSIPLKYKESTPTGRKKMNFTIETKKSKNKILRSRFENYEVENKKTLSIFGIKIHIQNELEMEVVEKEYTEKQAIEKAMELSREKIEMKLDENEYIIAQKVLKKQMNNSTIDLEIFYSVNELISSSEEFVPEIKTEEE